MVVLEILSTLVVATLGIIGLYYKSKYEEYKRLYEECVNPKPTVSTKTEKAKEEREHWLVIRSQILLRDHFRCQECGYYKHLEVHHIIPKSKGGTDDPSNLITLCTRCHEKKHGITRKREAKRRKHTRKNRRKKLRRYINRHKKNLPSFPIQSLEGAEPYKEDLSSEAVARRQKLYEKWQRNELNQP
jgi:5-methylcytosine-specific restriction endonuclease McrA